MTKKYVEAAKDLEDNKEQLAAYNSKDNCVILAGPGSGKTKTITLKIARILEEDIKLPQKVACITYSNSCVGELQARLKKLEVEEGRRILISTVHSFCLTELVLPFGKLAGLSIPEPFSVASPAKSRQIFNECCKKILGSEQRPFFRTTCDKLRRTIPDKGSDAWKKADSSQVKIIEAYERELNNLGMIDFDGLILWGLELVEKHDWVRKCVKAKYPILIIDEYQDLGLPLHRIVVSLMLKAGVRIIAVGDPDQSIYGFTGANPSLLRDLSNDSKVEDVLLKLNYRCADRIIDASKSLLTSPPTFKSFDGRKGEILFYQTGHNLLGQAKHAFDVIIPQLLNDNKKLKMGDIVFLYRKFADADPIAQIADERGISYFRLDNGAAIKRSKFIDWLSDMAKFSTGGWETGSISLTQIFKSWRSFRKTLIRDHDILEEKSRIISTLYKNRDKKMSLKVWLEIIHENLLKIIFEEEIGLGDEQESIESLIEESKVGGRLEKMNLEIFANQGKSPDQINLMTLHASKGLEFEIVFILGLEKNDFPDSRDRDQQLAESTRLFYVGVTRAKNQVHLMYNQIESPFITKIRNAIR